jgi:hypothetical protein
MTALPAAVKVNGNEIVAKVIDGEAVIMNVKSGVYYSMTGAGVFLWERLATGVPLDAILVEMERAYEVSADQLRSDVQALVTSCLEEGVLLPVAAADAALPVSTPPARGERNVYAPPVLQIYRDMMDLLAIDPPAPSFSDLEWKR